jgi:hypothetical protein
MFDHFPSYLSFQFGFILFLSFFSYFMLYAFAPISSSSLMMHWTEILTIITVTTMLFEELRQVSIVLFLSTIWSLANLCLVSSSPRTIDRCWLNFVLISIWIIECRIYVWFYPPMFYSILDLSCVLHREMPTVSYLQGSFDHCFSIRRSRFICVE